MADGGRPIVLNHSFLKGREGRGVDANTSSITRSDHSEMRISIHDSASYDSSVSNVLYVSSSVLRQKPQKMEKNRNAFFSLASAGTLSDPFFH